MEVGGARNGIPYIAGNFYRYMVRWYMYICTWHAYTCTALEQINIPHMLTIAAAPYQMIDVWMESSGSEGELFVCSRCKTRSLACTEI